nr:MAG TPA: hypothetical protein [Caudoviricetes sp.]
MVYVISTGRLRNHHDWIRANFFSNGFSKITNIFF